jgi:hypothetical protein
VRVYTFSDGHARSRHHADPRSLAGSRPPRADHRLHQCREPAPGAWRGAASAISRCGWPWARSPACGARAPDRIRRCWRWQAIPPTVLFAWSPSTRSRGSMPASIARFVPGGRQCRWISGSWRSRRLIALAAAVLFGIDPRPAVHTAAALRHTERGRTQAQRPAGRGRESAAPGRGRDHACAFRCWSRLPMGAVGAHRFLYGRQGYDADRVLVMEMVLPRPPTKETTPGAISSERVARPGRRHSWRRTVRGGQHHAGPRQ